MPEHDESSDYLALELLSELKASGSRQATQIKTLQRAIVGIVASAFLVVLATVAGFLWYLNQYDFSSTETTTTHATGVYALIDSEGNVIAADLSEETIMEMIENGESEFEENDNPEED